MKKSWFVIAAAIPLVAIGSAAVWLVSGNDPRRIGALEALKEPVPLAWRGSWSADLRYAAGEVVSYRGVAYVAEREAGGEIPDPAACGGDCPWTAMGSKGEQGPKGDGFRWLGAQSEADYCAKTYHPGDVVAFQGSAWSPGSAIGGCVGPPHAPWEVIAKKGDNGAAGAVGPKGDKGEKGDPGPPGGISGYEIVRSQMFSIAPGTAQHVATVYCPSGKKVLGGGAALYGGDPTRSRTVYSVATVDQSVVPYRYGWTVQLRYNETGSSLNLTGQAVAVCATA
jgi:hypothetical protein